MDKKTKALIKDLELQIDYLVGYSPCGEHWKKEYHIRQRLIDETLTSDTVPEEIKEKLNRIQDSLYRLINKQKHDQHYISYSENEYTLSHPILVRGYEDGEWKEYYI